MTASKESSMADSVYKVIDLVGTSTDSWEKATSVALKTAARSLRDLRVAEVRQLDVHLEEGKLVYRVKLSVSFKYHD
jgi:flavin-binding protein dodecin